MISGLGFDKSSRLLSSADFSYLQDKAFRTHTKYMRAYSKKSRIGCDKTRIGISVSKKVGNAVRRNRTKRLIREKFRKSQFRNMGRDVLIVISPKLYKDFDNLSEAEDKLLGSFHWLLSQISKNHA